MTVSVHLRPSGEVRRFKNARNGAYGWNEYVPDYDHVGSLQIVRVSHAVVVDDRGSRPWYWTVVAREVVAEFDNDDVLRHDAEPGFPPELKQWSSLPREGLLRKRVVLPDDPFAGALDD